MRYGIPLLLLLVLACGDDDVDDTDRIADASIEDAATEHDSATRDATPGDDGAVDMGPLVPGSPCAPLAAPTGTVVEVDPSMADQLPGIVAAAETGTTILLADGTYRSTATGEGSRRLIFRTPGVALRSASGNAEAVVIDGEYLTNELLFVLASDVTIAELTLMRAVDHLVHVSTADGVGIEGVTMHGVRFIDSGEQFVKINSGGGDAFADDGVVACSFFQLTEAGRPNIERDPGGCYTGGIDAHASRGWVIRHNRFEDIYCAGEGLAEHAVHFWRSSRDTLVENNLILGCARGVGFGLDSGESRTYADDPYPGVAPISHFDGIIRNNVIYADHPYYDTGIELSYARGARVHHNTVVHGDGATGVYSSIDYRWPTTEVSIRNNIAQRITMRNDGNATLEANLEDPAHSIFVDPTAGDFHLEASATDAIDQGVVVEEPGLDIDGEPHTNGPPDIGADER